MALIVGNVDERLTTLEGRMGKVEQTLDHMQSDMVEMHKQNSEIINLLNGKADRTFRGMLLGFTALAGLGVFEIMARFLH